MAASADRTEVQQLDVHRRHLAGRCSDTHEIGAADTARPPSYPGPGQQPT